ncbi:MAG: phenylalanyl-tRNA synthetase subunit beta, partial [uncultured bacterium]
VFSSKYVHPQLTPLTSPKTILPIDVRANPGLALRYSGVVVKGVTVKPSPKFIQERLSKAGLRPLNNLVDITNYVMLELGVPLHVFDYRSLAKPKLVIELSVGGERFTSVDGLTYKLPKNAIVIKDKYRVLDLCGIKGAKDTGVSDKTTDIYIHVPIYDPLLIRKASQQLKLVSEASYIYERGVNVGGTIEALTRATNLIQQYAGGEVASQIIDIQNTKTLPKIVNLSKAKLAKVLGISLADQEIISILTRLGIKLLSKRKETFSFQIPTRRLDIAIEEDLVEEVARIYGYNRFPKTLPTGGTRSEILPYHHDRNFEWHIKDLLVASGFTEIMTLSLLSKDVLVNSHFFSRNLIQIANPVSEDYCYMRPSLMPSLILAVKTNPEALNVAFFELSKVYVGPASKKQELYKVGGITNYGNWAKIKGVMDFMLERLTISSVKFRSFSGGGIYHPAKAVEIVSQKSVLGVVAEINPGVTNNFALKKSLWGFELDMLALDKLAKNTTFKPIPPYPAQIEDITLALPKNTYIGDVVDFIKSQRKLFIVDSKHTGTFENFSTFRIWYQHPSKTLTDKEVEKSRRALLTFLKNKYAASSK